MKERYETQLTDMERQLGLYRTRLTQLEALLRQYAPTVPFPPEDPSFQAAHSQASHATRVATPAVVAAPADQALLKRLPSRQVHSQAPAGEMDG